MSPTSRTISARNTAAGCRRAVAYGKSGNKWIDIPVCYSGNMHELPHSSIEEGRLLEIPRRPPTSSSNTPRRRSATTRPGGLALGHASGDANAWVHWCLWAHGGNLVDKNDKVIINSPETEKALDYAKQLYENMIPGTASWNDAFNNKAFLAGEIHWTNNGISIYAAAKKDPTKKEIAEDMDHANVAGRPGRQADRVPSLLSDAGDELHQVSASLQGVDGVHAGGGEIQQVAQASVGYLTHALNAYDANPVWTADPKRTVFRDVAKRTLTAGGSARSARKRRPRSPISCVVDMFANCLHRPRGRQGRDQDRRTPGASGSIAEVSARGSPARAGHA